MLKKIALLAAALLVAACATTPGGREQAAAVEAKLARGVTLPPFETVILPNGMEILLMEKHDVPLIAFEAVVRGGALADPDGKSGTSALVAELLRKGAGGRTANQFAEAVEKVGGVMSTAAGKEALVVNGEFMARDADLMIELLGDLLMDPALARAEFDKLQKRSVQQIQAMKDTSLRSLISIYGDAYLFDEHPYARPSMGTEAGLTATAYADIRRYYIEHVGADRAILAVVGDFDTATMRARLEARFSGWRKAAGRLPEVAAAKRRNGNRVLLVDKPDATQTYFYIGNIGVARDYPHRAALDLVNTVFGGRFTSMLNTRLRVESGLTYGAGSRVVRYSEPGSLAITSFTRTETTAAAIDMALATLDQLHDQGLAARQLESAKAYLLGQFPPRLETAPAIASRLTDLRFYELDRSDIDHYAERVSAVGPGEVQKVISEVYAGRDNLTFVLIGNADAIREQVTQYGPVSEMKITDPAFQP